MKKILASLSLIIVASIPASAASKIKRANNAHIDRSMDEAYSAKWAHKAQSPEPQADFTIGTGNAYRPYMSGKTLYYGLSNFTLHGATAVHMNAPYQGGDAPSYDGAARNAYRNMRANNESEPLPDNSGSRR